MKKWAFFSLLFLFLSVQDVHAEEWKIGDELTGSLDFYKWSTHDHALSIEHDSRVTLTLNKVAGTNYNVVIDDQHGHSLASFSTQSIDSEDGAVDQAINLKAGTYTVKVAHYNGPVGNYKISYTTSPIAGTDIEPNNTNLSAIPMTIGQSYDGELSGFPISDDYDIYKLTVPEFGKVTIKGQLTNGVKLEDYGYFKIEGYAEANPEQQLFDIIFGKQWVEENAVKILMKPGVYYLKVPIWNSSSLEKKHYTLSTRLEPLDENSWENGTNLTNDTAFPIQNNKTYNGFFYSRIASYSQTTDYYKFSLMKESKVTILTQMDKMPGTVRIYNENGQAVAYFSSKTNTIAGTKKLKAGNYTLSFSSDRMENDSEDYTITLRLERFSDVPATHPSYKEIEQLAQLGINKGYADGTFHPTEAIKRKHVFSLLDRVENLKLPKVRTMKTFRDLPSTHPNYPEIKAFYEAGIIDGSGAYVKPESNLTRGEMAKILVNTFDLKMNGAPISFSDVHSSNGFYEYIQILATNGITLGSNGKFLAGEPVTRQQFSLFLYRVLNK